MTLRSIRAMIRKESEIVALNAGAYVALCSVALSMLYAGEEKVATITKGYRDTDTPVRGRLGIVTPNVPSQSNAKFVGVAQ